MKDTTLIQESQPVQVNQSSSTNNPYKYLFFTTIAILLAAVGVFYFVLNNKANQLKSDKINSKVSSEIVLQAPTITTQPTPNKQESTLTESDSNYNLYTNYKFGFSLIVSKFLTNQIDCGDKNLPITFFENGDTIYLASKSFYTPNSCQKNTTTWEDFKSTNYSLSRLKIYAANVKDDSSLENYLKSKYGSGCKLGQKTQSPTADIYNVKILGDGKDLSESDCPINFMVDVKYNPTKSTVVIFELGQACNLYQGQNCADSKVVSSLKFL